MKKAHKIVFSLIILLFPLWSAAQCSVCTAGAASTARTNGGYGAGINAGILYLLGVTYLVFAVFAVYFFRNSLRYHFRTMVTRWRMYTRVKSS